MTEVEYEKRSEEISKLEGSSKTTNKQGRELLEKKIEKLTELENELSTKLNELLKASDGEDTEESEEVEMFYMETGEWLGESMGALSEWPED